MINLLIVTPEKEIIDHKKVNYVHVTLSDGNPISIYPSHAPLVAIIGEGKLIYEDEEESRAILISDGFIHVNNNIVKCYVEWADRTMVERKNDSR